MREERLKILYHSLRHVNKGRSHVDIGRRGRANGKKKMPGENVEGKRVAYEPKTQLKAGLKEMPSNRYLLHFERDFE